MHMLQKLEPGAVSGLAAALSGAAQTPLSRRFVLAAMGGAGIGLVLGLKADVAHAAPAGANAAGQAFNPFVKIAPDGTVTVIVKHLDKGQGIATGLATLAADEMDADWSKVTTQFAPADGKTYGNALFGGAQGTGGSTSIAASYTVYRNAGAAARAMLVAAAARQWGVDPATIKVSKGVVSAGSRSAGFGALAEAAAKEPVPAEPKLKEASAFTLIGKEGVHRVDNAAKTTGARIYTQDLKLPDMLVAVVAHPPRFGATPKSFDATAAKAVKGVQDVVMVPQGVAVLATTTHAAIKGRDALKVEWDESKAETRSTADMLADYRGALAKPGLPVETHGDVEAALKAPRREAGGGGVRVPLSRPRRHGAHERSGAGEGRGGHHLDRLAASRRRCTPTPPGPPAFRRTRWRSGPNGPAAASAAGRSPAPTSWWRRWPSPRPTARACR